MVFNFFRKKGPDYENELPKLAKEIKNLKANVLRAKYAHRRWPFTFLLGSSALYVVMVSLFLTRTMRGKKAVTFLLATPPLIWLVRRLICACTDYNLRKKEARLEKIVGQRRKLVEAYKEKTNFEKIQQLVEEDEDYKEPKDLNHTDATDKNAGSSSANKSAEILGQPMSNNAFGKLNRPELQHDPVSVYRSSWVDRVIDLIIGENEQSPTNRQALICSNCHVHNGLAPFGQTSDEIRYICPVCGFDNNNHSALSQSASTDESESRSIEIAEPESDKKESE